MSISFFILTKRYAARLVLERGLIKFFGKTIKISWDSFQNHILEQRFKSMSSRFYI